MKVNLEQLVKLRARMPKMDFMQILNVSEQSTDDDVKNAFRERSRRFHPDRFYRQDPRVRQIATDIYKQIALSYNALKTQRFRNTYFEKISEDREKFLRFNPARYVDRSMEEIAERQTGPGAKYYELAEKSIIAKEKKSAQNNIKLALMMEPENAVYLKAKERIEAL